MQELDELIKLLNLNMQVMSVPPSVLKRTRQAVHLAEVIKIKIGVLRDHAEYNTIDKTKLEELLKLSA